MDKIWKKTTQKLKRPKNHWHFNDTPDSLAEMLRRIHFLLEHSSIGKHADDILRSEYFPALVYGYNRKLGWERLQHEIEQKIGRIANDSMSTLATTDDNPGTGRSIDKYVYQPVGRSIERIFLSLELKYFRPPEKNARQIIRFLENCAFSGEYIPAGTLCLHTFNYLAGLLPDEDLEEKCISLFVEISREERIAKAFQRLLIQASSKQRSLRVEAQKILWSLFRYKNIVFILNIITNLESLLRDGYSTFQHCSPLDPEYQTHFCFRWEMAYCQDNAIVKMDYTDAGDELLSIPLRDILETCVRGNRGFSSLPISLVFEHFIQNLTSSRATDEEPEDPEKTAENLYLAVLAITGLSTEFPYALEILRTYEISSPYPDELESILPLRGKEKTASGVNALELMVHSVISLVMLLPEYTSEAEGELRYCTTLLNQNEMGESEARASEDYLRTVNKSLVERGPITFTVLKDIVTNPLTWEKYCRPERQTEAKEETRVPSPWDYELRISKTAFLGCTIPFYDYIPFSDYSFRGDDFDALLDYIREGQTYRVFEGLRTYWFKIQRWLIALAMDSMALRGDRPYTDLYWVMEWWRTFNPAKPPSSFDVVSFQRRLHGKPIAWTPANIRAQLKEFSRLPSIIEGADPPVISNQPQPRSDSPCLCTICKRTLRIPEKVEDTPQQRWMKYGPARPFAPFLGQSGRMSHPLCEGGDQARRLTPLLRRHRDRVEEGEEGGEEEADVHLQRKRQKTSSSFDASDTDSIMTEVDDGPPPSYDNDMSEDEDFWSAKSVAELSILSIDN